MKDRIPSLDGLRGIASVAIMMFHLNIFFVPQAQLTSLIPVLGRAYLAVDLFFILSGFVMAHVYGAALAWRPGETWRPFAVARFARIYPLFALTTLATVAVVTLAGATPAFYVSFSGAALTLQPLLLQQWASSLTWNYPAWSISTEAEAYVLFVFLAAPLLRGRHPGMIAACCLLAVVVLSIAGGGSLNTFSGVGALVRTVAEFCLGALLYRAYAKDVGFLRVWSWPLALGCLGAGFVVRQDFLAVAGLACLTLYGAGATGRFGRLLNCRPAIALGDWSYSIYLLHAPVHLAIAGILAQSRHPVGAMGLAEARALAFATALIVVGLAAVTYRCFEKPARRWIMGEAGFAISHLGARPAK